jgi:uncharacterized protein (DUF736 family)
MAQIGNFKRDEKGNLAGTIKTLALNLKTAFRTSDKDSDKSPDYRIFAGGFECGAAWKKTSQNDREYLSVKIDDPSFPAPIYASLLEGDDGEHRLIWSR